MIEINCPACSGPDNADCATCLGTSKVTQQAFNSFMAQKTRLEESQIFWDRVQKHINQAGKFRFEANGQVFELDN